MDETTPASASVITGKPKHIGDLDINPADDGYIIYRPDQDCVHYLNPTAVFILELCNGENSVDWIVESVMQAYGLTAPPVQVVQDALKTLKSEGLLMESA